MTVNPIFLPIVPDRKPRTECGCQPVAFISSLAVTPPGRFSSSKMRSVLLPSRGPELSLDFAPFLAWGAFLAGLAFFPDLPFFGATWARRAPALAFFFAFGSSAWATVAASVVSVSDVMLFLLLWDRCHDIDHSGAERLQDN